MSPQEKEFINHICEVIKVCHVNTAWLVEWGYYKFVNARRWTEMMILGTEYTIKFYAEFQPQLFSDSRYEVTKLWVSYEGSTILETSNDNIVRCFYERLCELKKIEDEKIAMKRYSLMQELIIEDSKKILWQKRFDEMAYVFDKRKRLDEITQEAISIRNEFAIVPSK